MRSGSLAMLAWMLALPGLAFAQAQPPPPRGRPPAAAARAARRPQGRR